MESGRLWRFDLSVVVFIALLTARSKVESTAILSYRIAQGYPGFMSHIPNTPCYEPHRKLFWHSYLLESCVAKHWDLLLSQRRQWLLKVLIPAEVKPGMWLCSNPVMFSPSAPLDFCLPWLRILIEWPWNCSCGQCRNSISSAGKMNISHAFWVDPAILANSIANSCHGTAFILYSSNEELDIYFLLLMLQKVFFFSWIICKS